MTVRLETDLLPFVTSHPPMFATEKSAAAKNPDFPCNLRRRQHLSHVRAGESLHFKTSRQPAPMNTTHQSPNLNNSSNLASEGPFLTESLANENLPGEESESGTPNVANIGLGGQHSILSNLAPTPFTLEGIFFASAEAFIQCIKYPECPKRDRIALLDGYPAKRAGRKPNARIRKDLAEGREAFVHWKGEAIPYRSEAHMKLIETALRAKFGSSPEAAKALIQTGDAAITHDLGHKENPLTSLPAAVFCDILTRIREQMVNPSSPSELVEAS